MRAAMLFVLGCLASAPAFAGIWSNLWRTPDQQGEALLEAGHPARAAARFSDPRLKAYADLEADRYAQAAKLLARFKDVTSEYNRGNALAHSGHLRAALAAYDAALRQAPGDQDIRHNRNVVARRLRHRTAKPPAKSGTRGKSRRPSGGGQSQNQNQSPGQSQNRKRNRNHGQGKKIYPDGASGGASRSGSPADQSATRTAPQQTSGRGSRTRSPGRARRDAVRAAALARRQRHAGANASGARPATASGSAVAGVSGTRHRPGRVGGSADAPKSKPVSEKTLALEQWLRQIPNNPAGLLRRKFLIEYMMRHPGDKP